jgi:hypothetical protein
MITQKGLKDSDVFVIISENKTEATFNVGIPDCEKFEVVKKYASEQEYLANFTADLMEYKENLASTVFTISADDDEKDLVVNDSWGSIFSDALGSVKTKLFQKA